ncbi:MAG: helix-turn-helix transcriptional regulator [Spirochaetales bacterium]|nr:helix-turn-helix transcriptional regulator [Spirochaetales bacterium]
MEFIDRNGTDTRRFKDFRQLGIDGFEILGHYRYLKSESALRSEKFENLFEMIFVIKGLHNYEVEGEIYTLHGSEGLIIRPGEVHSTNNAPQQKGEIFWLIFSAECEVLARGLGISQEEASQIVSILSAGNLRTFRLNNEIADLLSKIFACDDDRSLLNRLYYKNSLTRLILAILDSSQWQVVPQMKSSPVFRAVKFIRENIFEKITISELAAACGISESYFKRLFTYEMGASPLDYVNRLKVEEAKLFLSEKKSVTTVAFDLGFSTSQYFATVFKKYTGLTPKEWQRGEN